MAKKDELNFENENNMASSEKLKALQAAMDMIEYLICFHMNIRLRKCLMLSERNCDNEYTYI